MMEEKQNFLKTAKELKRLNLVSVGCNKGSFSIKVGDKFIIGPSGMDYDELSIDDINIMNLDGTEYRCKNKISMDTQFHSAIYQNRTDVGCIIHTHSRYVSALAFAGKSIPFIQWGMKLQFNGSVESCDFFPPSDPKMNEEIVSKLGSKNAVLLKNHGGIAVGKSIKKAFENIIYLEELSESYVHAMNIGNIEIIGEKS